MLPSPSIQVPLSWSIEETLCRWRNASRGNTQRRRVHFFLSLNGRNIAIGEHSENVQFVDINIFNSDPNKQQKFALFQLGFFGPITAHRLLISVSLNVSLIIDLFNLFLTLDNNLPCFVSHLKLI